MLRLWGMVLRTGARWAGLLVLAVLVALAGFSSSAKAEGTQQVIFRLNCDCSNGFVVVEPDGSGEKYIVEVGSPIDLPLGRYQYTGYALGYMPWSDSMLLTGSVPTIEITVSFFDTDPRNQLVEFEQNELKRLIINELYGDDEVQDLSVYDLLVLRTLEIPDGGEGWQEALIYSLEGLQYARNLQHLDLRRQNIASLEPLEGLELLESVYLSGNPIESIEPLKDLPNLRVVEIENAKISSVPSFASGRMETLILNNNRIETVGDLSHLNQLHTLDLSHNLMEELPKLKSAALTALKFSNNKLKDISSLSPADLPNLTEVHLDINELEDDDLEALTRFEQLQTVHLEYNRLSNLTGFAANPENNLNWENLYLSENDITDAGLELLPRFANVKRLDVSGNRLTTLDPIKDMGSLVRLDAADNRIEVIPDFSVTGLKYLDLSGNLITDFVPLSNKNILDGGTLILRGNQIASLAFLSGGSYKFATLDISQNPLNSLGGIQTLANVQTLVLNDLPIRIIDDVLLLALNSSNLKHVELRLISKLESWQSPNLENLRSIVTANHTTHSHQLYWLGWDAVQTRVHGAPVRHQIHSHLQWDKEPPFPDTALYLMLEKDGQPLAPDQVAVLPKFGSPRLDANGGYWVYPDEKESSANGFTYPVEFLFSEPGDYDIVWHLYAKLPLPGYEDYKFIAAYGKESLRVEAAAAKGTPLSQVKGGSLVKFGGKTWVLADPENRILLLANAPTSMDWAPGFKYTSDPLDIKLMFSPGSGGAVANWLNTVFLGQLPELRLNWLQPTAPRVAYLKHDPNASLGATYYTDQSGNPEEYTSENVLVRLLTFEEYRAALDNGWLKPGDLRLDWPGNWYLMNPIEEQGGFSIAVVNSAGSLGSSSSYTYPPKVRPVVQLTEEVIVKGGNGASEPYLLEPPEPDVLFELQPAAPTRGTVDVAMTVLVYGQNNGLESIFWKQLPDGAEQELQAEPEGMTGPFVTVFKARATVGDNGEYQVTVRDTSGNERTQTVKIGNIFLTPPVIETEIKYSPGEANIHVEVIVEDGNGIASVKFAAGEWGTEDFDGLPSILPPGKTHTITVKENGKYTVLAKDLAGNVSAKVLDIDGIMKELPENDWNGNNCCIFDDSEPEQTGWPLIVNGSQVDSIVVVETSREGDRTKLTVTVDQKKLANLLENEGDQPEIIMPVSTVEADRVVVLLTADTIKLMEAKGAVLEIRTINGNYRLPAERIGVDRLAAEFGEGADLSQIVIRLEVSRSDASMVQLIEDAAQSGNFEVVAPPVDFALTAIHDGRTIEIDRFEAFIQREIPLPEGVDPSRITTAVVVEPDGTVRHVPTRVTQREGVHYAVVNSLTNSTYALVWNRKEFADVANHWSRDAVNDLASRMVVNGTGEGTFSPDKSVTRAELAAIMVRALGLSDKGGTAPFKDVRESDWFAGAVAKAYEYGLIKGYEDGTFRPNETITRQEAVAILHRAMKWTGLSVDGTGTDRTLARFADANEVADWAKDSFAAAVQLGLVQGSDAGLNPQGKLTRAEAAALVHRLLKKAGWID